MPASAPSDLTSATPEAARRSTFSFVISVVAMVATTAIASALLRSMALTSATSPDPRFYVHYSAGPAMPFPVIMDHDNGFAFVGVFVVFAVLLAVASRVAARALLGMGDRAKIALFLGLIAVLLVMLGFSTTFSLDAYAYVAFGRLLAVHGLDPYLTVLASGSTLADPVLAQIATLTNTPLPNENYGPLWTLLAAGLAWLAQGGGLAENVVAQRIAGAVALVIAAIGVHRLVREAPAGERERRTALFALHPLVLYESAGAGHNDMLMVAPLVWAFALVDAAPWAAGLLAGAAIAVKYVAAIAVPFAAIRAYRARGIGSSVSLVVIAIAVPIILFVPFRPSLQVLGGISNLGSTLIVSAQWLVDTWLPSLGQFAVAMAFAVAFVAVFVYSIVRYAMDRCGDHIVRSIAALLWVSPLLNPWYVQWLAPAAASPGRWATYAWWFSLFAMARYVEDAPRFPVTPADLATRIHMLEAVTVIILIAPLLISLVTRRRVADNLA